MALTLFWPPYSLASRSDLPSDLDDDVGGGVYDAATTLLLLMMMMMMMMMRLMKMTVTSKIR